MKNNPVNFNDPTGHWADEGCGTGGNGGGTGCNLPTPTIPSTGGGNDDDDEGGGGNNDILMDMKPGDIITFESVVDGKTVTYNYMLGLMDDHKTPGFWDLDTHSYVPYEVAATTVDLSDNWTIFRKTDPKGFGSYEVMSSSGTPSALGSFDYYWTGGVDDNPAYVEIYTQVDWATMPGHLANTVLGPALVSSFWYDAKPTITPLSQVAYFPLTNYVIGLMYFATDGPALSRYPIIHP